MGFLVFCDTEGRVMFEDFWAQTLLSSAGEEMDSLVIGLNTPLEQKP